MTDGAFQQRLEGRDRAEDRRRQVALLACLISLIGFAGTLFTSNDFYTYAGSVVAIAVLLYAYPVRRAWEAALRRFAPTENPPDSPIKPT